MTDAVIRARNLCRWYGDVIALNDVTVDVPPGVTGLLGPNGAGKSSFLRILAGELRPSEGTVEVLSERPFANPRFHRRLGYCPEGDRFFFEMRALDFVAHLLLLSGYRSREARLRAEAALAEVGMEQAAPHRMGALSRGMRQRVKLAQAIAHDPELLLLDEPLSGLDPLARHETQAMLRRRAAAGAAVLVSSHVLHEVAELTSRILLLHRGRLAAVGEVAEIRSLIDRRPHRVHLRCARPRRLAALVLGREDVRSVRIEDGGAWVETTRPDAFYGALPALLSEHGLSVTGLSSPDDRLESVFELLVR